MSDLVTRPSPDEGATSGPSLQANRLSWMSHWLKKGSNPSPVVNNSSLVSYKGPVDQKRALDAKVLATNITSETKKNVASLSDLPGPTLSLCRDTDDTFRLRTQNEHELDHKNISLALALDREDTPRDFELLHEKRMRSNGKHVMSNMLVEQKGDVVSSSGALNKRGPTCFSADHAEPSGPVLAFGRHISNDNFTCLDQGQCKFQKFSTFLFHEKKMNDNISDESVTDKNFLPFFFKKQSKSFPGHSAAGLYPCQSSISNRDIDSQRPCAGCLSLNRMPCSVRNVETMRICTMVDSVENSRIGPPKISQRSHHFLFTKETCLNMSKDCQAFREPMLSAHCEEKKFGGFLRLFPVIDSSNPQGVKIQPLLTSSDTEERETTDNPLTSKPSSTNDSSAQADNMQNNLKNQFIPSSMASFPLKKDDSVDENSPITAFDYSMEKVKTKRPIMEIPDINEEAPDLQPAGSSTDSKEPSTSRVHSLNAKHLFTCDEQTSRSEFSDQKDPTVDPEPSNRWIKRLRLSSADSFGVGTKRSEFEEASSRKKFNLFFDKIMKPNTLSSDPVSNKLPENAQMVLTHKMRSPNSEKGNQSLMLGCPWIQRWRQHSGAAPSLRDPEPHVICEPHSFKPGLHELGRKQFPSIGAMAMMGKTMNGIRSCEFKKKGPVVVWKTKEY